MSLPSVGAARSPARQGYGLVGGFLRSLERFPGRVALVVNGVPLTYDELWQQAMGIAAAIGASTPIEAPLVAILSHRSEVMYAGILGILAGGRGYVPLHPKFPVARLRKMLEASGCDTLIVDDGARSLLPEILDEIERPLTLILPDVKSGVVPDIDARRHRVIVRGSPEFSASTTPVIDPGPEGLAYLLFTSGSTGEPKGVPIRQGSVRAYVEFVCRRYGVTEHDRFSQMFDFTFDLSAHDMFACWEAGASLYCVPERAVMAPARFIRDHGITMWFSVPSVVAMLSRLHLLTPGAFPTLRHSLFCGEPLPAAAASDWQVAAPNSVVENLYGPTEATIAITHYQWNPATSPGECVNGIVPLGIAFDGQHADVVNEQGDMVPPGEIGELWLAGTQVTDGYWRDEERTRRQFVRRPRTGDMTWYRTGDLARRDARGCLYYLGRVDQQVKIRGYRVELQEVEAVLRAAGAAQVAAVAWPIKDGSADGIIAFVSGGALPPPPKLLEACRGQLPDYMVPRRIEVLDNLPLNANGKVDRVALRLVLEGAAA